MDVIIKDVALALLDVCTKQTMPIDLVKIGVELLQNKPISNVEKKAILKQILTDIAVGQDGVKGTYDDRLSENTLGLLIILIEADLTDVIITGVVSGAKKVTSKCFGFW